MKLFSTLKNFNCSILFLIFLSSALQAQLTKAPAYPLITHDPYFSIWSFADSLNTKTTTHWTGSTQSLVGHLKTDGKVYRFLGANEKSYTTILPASDEKNYSVPYTENQPAENWMNESFDDTQWSAGTAPFGNLDNAKTQWLKRDIWFRRVFTVNDESVENLYLKTKHDDDCEIFLNGEKIYSSGLVNKFKYTLIKGRLKKGKNILAVHGINTGGESWLDAGLVTEKKEEKDNELIAIQRSVTVTATQTVYDFACGNINLKLTFTSPLLLNRLDLLSRPVSYVSFKAVSADGAMHKMQICFGASTDIAVNTSAQQVMAKKESLNGLTILKAGTEEQSILKKKGDDLRIDWGYMYLAAPTANAVQYISTAEDLVNQFTKGKFAEQANITGKKLMLNTVLDFGSVGAVASSKFLLMGYDDLFSVQYFGDNLKPWWKKTDADNIEAQLKKAATDYKIVTELCTAFDKKLYADALNAGGKDYADICILAYRQSIAAHKLVKSTKGETLFLSKENYSNGSINTVDVTYPSAPLFLLYNPELLKGMLNGIFYYSESGNWKKDFAAHDLGTYPLANGQTYGEDMPVEESGNMLILTAAIAKAEGNADYAKKHWATLTKWAGFLSVAGFDPANQLCTDDFAGHLSRNANLSVKAIIGLRCYGMLAAMLHDNKTADTYIKMTSEMVSKWMQLALDKDHYVLAFGNNNTWSQKYNLVWDKVLNLKLFPEEVYKKEVSYYLSKQNAFGLPLDSRKSYSKSDWILWTAVLSDNKKSFEAFVAPVHKYVVETTSRVPISDWHETTDGKMVGFQARSVVGGYFMKLVEQKFDRKEKILSHK
ncbi:MAG TPA: DUF4965 domain-containing protein [Flavisolibacter sp.]|nr:DUF4965 domain-containing protein [Flavisolibacter sp.]